LLQQALAEVAEVAEVAEAQGFRPFAVAEPLLKLAEVDGRPVGLQQASAMPQQPEILELP
jgi:hypothetical protein